MNPPATHSSQVGPVSGKWAGESCLDGNQFLLGPRPGLLACLTSEPERWGQRGPRLPREEEPLPRKDLGSPPRSGLKVG